MWRSEAVHKKALSEQEPCKYGFLGCAAFALKGNYGFCGDHREQAAAASPLFAFWLGVDALALAVGLMAVMIFVRHHANISRLFAGTEPRVGKKR